MKFQLIKIKTLISSITIAIIVLLGLQLTESINSFNLSGVKSTLERKQYIEKVQRINTVELLHAEIGKLVTIQAKESDLNSEKAIERFFLLTLTILLIIINYVVVLLKIGKLS